MCSGRTYLQTQKDQIHCDCSIGRFCYYINYCCLHYEQICDVAIVLGKCLSLPVVKCVAGKKQLSWLLYTKKIGLTTDFLDGNVKNREKKNGMHPIMEASLKKRRSEWHIDVLAVVFLFRVGGQRILIHKYVHVLLVLKDGSAVVHDGGDDGVEDNGQQTT